MAKVNNFNWFLRVILVFVFITNYQLPITNYRLYAQDIREEESFFIAQKAFDDGFYEVSLGLLERFLKTYPSTDKSAEVNLLIGECYYYQNKFLDALNKFEALLKEPTAEKIKDAVFYWIAEVHFKGNDFTKAGEAYRKLIDEFPNSSYVPSAYYSLGWCLFQEGKYQQALANFEIVEQRFPKSAQAEESSYKAVECLYQLKDYAGLKGRADFYLKRYPKDAAKSVYLYFYLGEADYYLGNFIQACDSYSKAILNAKDEKIKAISQLGMGWAYLKAKQYQQAEDLLFSIKADDLQKVSHDGLLLAEALLYFETSRFTQSKDIYEQLIKAAADPVVLAQAYLGRSDAYYSLAEYKQAIAAYKEALDKTSGSGSPEITDKLHYGLAWAYLKEAEFKSAIDEFQKVALQSEDKLIKVAALCQIGDTYQDSGEYTKASEVYDTILKDYPNSLYADYVQYQLGLTLLKSANYQGAVIALESLKANFPQSKLLDDATYALGLAYFQGEDYQASKEIFEKFQAEFKDSSLRPQALYLLGTSLYNLAKFSEAIEAFKNIIRLYGEEKEIVQKAEYEIADCFYQMGNEKEAIARFKSLRSKYPDSTLTAEIMWWLGEYYYRRDDLILARRYFSSLIQDFPNSNLVASCYYALGSTYAREAKFNEALDNFAKVAGLGKSELAGQAAVAIADIYQRQDKPDLALASYEKAAADYPNLNNLIYPKIAQIHNTLGNFDEAVRVYRKCLDIVPLRQLPDIQMKIAECLEASGKSDEAIEEYLKVAYLYSENSENSSLSVKALLRVAKLYEDKANFKEAVNIYKRVVSLNTEEAKYAQERLEWIKRHTK